MTNYSRGATFERAVKVHLENHGYTVIRAAGSHGPMDLVAFKPAGPYPAIWFVQCKINGKLPPTERRELYDVATPCGAWPVKASRPGRGTIRYERYFKTGKELWVDIYP